VADQDDPGLSDLLKPGCEIRGVAYRGVDHSQVVANLPYDHGAGVHSNPHGKRGGRGARNFGLSIANAALDAERREHRASSMVLVCEWSTKQRHEAVSKELVDGAFVPMDLSEREVEETVEETVHRLATNPLGEGGGVDDVAEEHRHMLALAFEGALGREDLLGKMLGSVGLRRAESLSRRGSGR